MLFRRGRPQRHGRALLASDRREAGISYKIGPRHGQDCPTEPCIVWARPSGARDRQHRVRIRVAPLDRLPHRRRHPRRGRRGSASPWPPSAATSSPTSCRGSCTGRATPSVTRRRRSSVPTSCGRSASTTSIRKTSPATTSSRRTATTASWRRRCWPLLLFIMPRDDRRAVLHVRGHRVHVVLRVLHQPVPQVGAHQEPGRAGCGCCSGRA